MYIDKTIAQKIINTIGPVTFDTTTMEILSRLERQFSIAQSAEQDAYNEIKRSIIEQIQTRELINTVDQENPDGGNLWVLLGPAAIRGETPDGDGS